ncbi:SDR family oxidoreductase [Paenibacillus sp. UMB4589-SE434]|uniref:SDR family oxidoreductase n=1 Tax=Paenibacillus sp. UMB4589-SE434 TaxID=3046314 RepID=UPI00254B70E8|nr:SDR family oxidoreductase [Paenibacillus sp. UMB4589-SE434]MDK8182553.1 SDR family oxidoreductase [Paenibacillus sp. UMB4589-SE434]
MGYELVKLPKGTLFLVTGVAGFIGSNLAETLLDMGMKVRGLDNFSTGKQVNVSLFANNPNYTFIEGDIRDFDTCQQACKDAEYVLHQAALGSVPRSIEEPLLYEENNVKGTLNVMEAARLSGKVKRFVYASSSSVYGDSEELPKHEGAEGQLLSPYAATKLVNEHYGSLYTRLYNMPCIGLRYFNVFGPRQDPDSQYAAVIPIFSKLLLTGERPTINGDGRQTRDFTYIDNVIEANIKACVADEAACGETFNIACGERFSLLNMLKNMCERLEVAYDPVFGPDRPGDIKHSLADISKARMLLGYEGEWNFHSGFDRAADWYRSYFEQNVSTN